MVATKPVHSITVQILTEGEGNIEFISPRGKKYCPTRRRGIIFIPEWGYIINGAQKNE